MRRVQRAMTTGENAPFREIWRLLLFAATIGYQQQKRVPLKNVEAGKSMPQDYFTNNPVWPGIQYLMALATEGDASMLGGSDNDDDKRLQIFEEYANAGLATLQDVLENSSYSLDALIAFVATSTATPEENTLGNVTI